MTRNILLLLLTFLFTQCDNPKVKMGDNHQQSPENEVKTLSTKKEEKTVRLERKTPKKQEIKSPSLVKEATMTGYFVYAADAATFQPCGSNERFPVMMEDDYIKMERAYLGFKDLEFAEKIYAKVIGDYLTDEGMEEKQKKHLVVKTFLGFERGTKCD